ncbi:tetraspanin-2-like [Macadamia integrifolia]|uniref:tetraspanin-2-like n=1 Tax=Macadamia integrifolia TaxID=60698 RepID=UPI001C4E3DAC|nr:tetraspanin-2-like [Macadamia integrifolia]
MADAEKFPGIASIAIVDGLLAFILFIILFNISSSCWSLKYWCLTLLEIAFIFVSTIGMLAALLGFHQALLNYFLMKLLLTLVFTIFVIASWKVGQGNWVHLKDCLRKAEFCQNQVSANMLNPIFNACCEEPSSCNSSSSTSKNSSFHDPSCHLWSTNSTILCYECQSCRDAVLGDFRLSGKSAAMLSTIFLGIFLSLYIAQIFLYCKGTERSSNRVAPSSDQA